MNVSPNLMSVQFLLRYFIRDQSHGPRYLMLDVNGFLDVSPTVNYLLVDDPKPLDAVSSFRPTTKSYFTYMQTELLLYFEFAFAPLPPVCMCVCLGN